MPHSPTRRGVLVSRKLAGREPATRLELHFRPHERLEHVTDPLPRNVSAVAVMGRTMFAAGDETATIERLARTGDGDGRRAALAVLVDLDRDPNRMPPI
jgi:hypothetical protein